MANIPLLGAEVTSDFPQKVLNVARGNEECCRISVFHFRAMHPNVFDTQLLIH